MSRLMARIMLAVFMLPLAAMIYCILVAVLMRLSNYSNRTFFVWAVSGIVTWAFVAGYWTNLWKGAVHWTPRRINLTICSALGALAIGSLMAAALDGIVSGFGWFAGTATMPLLWLVGSTLVWRETVAERAARLKASGANYVICPACGYNLTGLSEARCPECGGRYTLDELFAAQPARESDEVEA